MYEFYFYTFSKVAGSFFLLISILGISSQLIILVLSGLEMRDYRRRNRYIDYEDILSSPFLPSVSILAPAFNEEETIVQNAKSLLSLQYAKLQVIIINDGSKDNSLQSLIEAFDLQKTAYAYNDKISTQKVRGVYKSSKQFYKKLIVIDKENGGKADALNAGINVSTGEILACIDADCILSSDSILKMIRPFMEEVNERVIAVGGVIGVANNCDVVDGKVTKYRMPKSMLGRLQVAEYLRAFLMGKMAAARINGLLLISGAFGFFRRDIVVEVGGYLTQTVGEDMELVVRLRRHMAEKKIPYKVGFVADPLCWTEVPESTEILSKQRNRWMRGNIETLKLHRKIKLNPKYGLMAFISYPYTSLLEKLAPIIEISGVIYTVALIIIGDFSVFYFLAIAIGMYFAFVLMSTFGILYEQIFYNNYKDRNDLWRLLWSIVSEPFVVHPMVVWWGVKGHIDFLTGKGGWGKMMRKGFNKAVDKNEIQVTK